MSLSANGGTLILEASSEGEWGNNLQCTVDHETRDKDAPSPDQKLFNLKIREVAPETRQVVASETFLNVSSDPDSSRFIAKVLEQDSAFVRVRGTVPAVRPDAATTSSNDDGGDGSELRDGQMSDPGLEAEKKGIWALEKADLFNLLCIPPLTRSTDVGADTTLKAALAYCRERRALLIVDPPSSWRDAAGAQSGVDALRSALGAANTMNTAVYFPRIRMADPLKENRTDEFVPCGAVAGIIARTDAERGVWKAPAGIEASFSGVRELSCKLTDGDNGRLNPLGINCLRTFPVYGQVAWGARTLAGADRLASEWKYLPVRRLALFIEESLYRGTQWVVFEPNNEPLWSQIRLNIGAFLQNLFRQGAFQGVSPREAYFVKCDKETTTRNDVNRGIVNILVGFAPLKPAEFVIIKIQQIAGHSET